MLRFGSSVAKQITTFFDNNPLHSISCQGTSEDIKKMEERCKNKPKLLETPQGIFKRTPLCHAIVENHKKCVQFFLEYGANIETKDINGFNALLLAVWAYYETYKRKNGPTIIHMLLNAGANPNVMLKTQYPPPTPNGKYHILHTILMEEDFKLAFQFLLKGADINEISIYAGDGMEYTFLGFYISINKQVHIKIIRFLLSYNATIQVKVSGIDTCCLTIQNKPKLNPYILKELCIHGVLIDLMNISSLCIHPCIIQAPDRIKRRNIKILKKFGILMQFSRVFHKLELTDEEFRGMTVDFYKPRGPLKLRDLSRLALVHHYRYHYPYVIKHFDVPATLRPILRFDDA